MSWEKITSTEVLSALALLVSVGSFGWTWYRTRASTRLHEEQMASMRIVTSRTLVLWEYLKTFAALQRNGRLKKDDSAAQSSLAAYQKAAQRLEEALDSATGLGLLPVLAGDDDVSLVAYSFFLQDLHWTVTTSDPGELLTGQTGRLTHGVIRLMNACRTYSPTSLPSTMFDSLDRVSEDMWNSAWQGLKEPARKATNQ